MPVTASRPEVLPGRRIRAGLPLLVGAWLSLSVLLVWLLMYYANTPGRPAESGHGPMLGNTPAKPGEWTLVIFLHPHCPCSLASLQQAAELAERHPTLRVKVYLIKPPGCPEGWEEGRISRLARENKGLSVAVDVDGQEARRCGAHTSGQTFLSDATGRVRFKGGLTDSRGHQGNSVGSAAVAALVEKDSSDVVETAVFGCALLEDD